MHVHRLFSTKLKFDSWTLRRLLKIEFLEFFCAVLFTLKSFFSRLIIAGIFLCISRESIGHWRRSGMELRGLRGAVASSEFLQRVFLSPIEIFLLHLRKTWTLNCAQKEKRRHWSTLSNKSSIIRGILKCRQITTLPIKTTFLLHQKTQLDSFFWSMMFFSGPS